MNVMDHTPLRDLLEDAEARGSVDADEVEAAIAGLDLTEEDEADLRRQLDEMDVEVVAVRPAEPDVVEADDKRRARLNCIAHFLSRIPYEDRTPEPVDLPPRQSEDGYRRPDRGTQTYVPDHAAVLD